MKPLIIFQGDLFETDFEFVRIKKFFFEFFKLYDIEDINISILKRMIVFSAASDKIIKIRSFELSEINEHSIKENLKMKINCKEIMRMFLIQLEMLELDVEHYLSLVF